MKNKKPPKLVPYSYVRALRKQGMRLLTELELAEHEIERLEEQIELSRYSYQSYQEERLGLLAYIKNLKKQLDVCRGIKKGDLSP